MKARVVALEAALVDGCVAAIEGAAIRLARRMGTPFLDAPAAVRALYAAAAMLVEEGKVDVAEALFERARFGARRAIAVAVSRDRDFIRGRLGEVAGIPQGWQRAQP